MRIQWQPMQEGDVLPLSFSSLEPMPSITVQEAFLPPLPVGTRLFLDGKELFCVVGRALMPSLPTHTSSAQKQHGGATHACYLPLLRASTSLHTAEEACVEKGRQGHALAWVTLSDKGSVGQREDKSGPLIGEMLRNTMDFCHEQGFLLPDDAAALRTLLLELSLGQGYDIICTTGGTGLGPRDVTPEAMLACIDKRLYGFEQVMMAASLQKTPHAALSRAVVGTIGNTLCLNLPGSVKAVRENLEAILPALPHALQKIHGDSTDCGG